VPTNTHGDLCHREWSRIGIFPREADATALTEQTGGRVFFDPHGDDLLKDLTLMEAEQRTQYRLVYKPSNFKADSSFHTVRLRCSVSGARITARSGYYAFARP
jgi:hypothetical protein